MLLLFPPTEGDIPLVSCAGGGEGIVFRTRRAKTSLFNTRVGVRLKVAHGLSTDKITALFYPVRSRNTPSAYLKSIDSFFSA